MERPRWRLDGYDVDAMRAIRAGWTATGSDYKEEVWHCGYWKLDGKHVGSGGMSASGGIDNKVQGGWD